MRATCIRPRTAPPTISERPGTAYSTRSTIRQVEPSPGSLSDAPAVFLEDGDVPAPGTSCQAFSPSGLHWDEISKSEPESYNSSTNIYSNTEAACLRRGGTPSGRSSPRKSRSCSPQKSRSQSPQKLLVVTPTLLAHQESPSSSYSGKENECLGPPDTPSPTTGEQQKQAYAPLDISRPFAAQDRVHGEKMGGYGTHVRIADYMRKMKDQRPDKSLPPKRGQNELQVPVSKVRVINSPAPHIVQAMRQPNDVRAPQNLKVPNQSPIREPARHMSVSRHSETSGTSVTSKHSIFSTPGRDEMERKKPIVEEDEGPFAKATSMQNLEQARRRVSEMEGGEGKGEAKRRVCGIRCAVM